MSKLMKPRMVKVSTPFGDRYQEFIGVDTDKLNEMKCAACTAVCPYGEKKCRTYPDPRDPSDPERSYMDLCSDLGNVDNVSERDVELNHFVPAPMSIEKAYPDIIPDLYQKAIKEKMLVSIPEIIDKLCPGTCASYREDKSECKSTNEFCWLAQVFENEDYDIELANKLIKKDKNPMADSPSDEEQLKVESNSN